MATDVVEMQVGPDVIHLQELAGLPSSVMDIALAYGAPTVCTLQDYWLLCPTFKLLGRHCLERDVGHGCVETVADERRPPGLLLEATVHHDLLNREGLRRVGIALGHERRERLARFVGALHRHRAALTPDTSRCAAAYQRRRDVNVERLNRLDRVLAMSNRVAEIHARLGVEEDRL